MNLERRYTLKNKNKEQDGLDIVYTCGGCADDSFIEEAFEAYRLASKKRIHMGIVSVTPGKLPRQLVEFRFRRLCKLKQTHVSVSILRPGPRDGEQRNVEAPIFFYSWQFQRPICSLVFLGASSLGASS